MPFESLTDALDVRYQRACEICNAAAELPAGERAEYLRTELGADVALTREVEYLRDAVGGSTSFLGPPPFQGVLRDLVDTPAQDLIPEFVGPYRILEPLGSGGSGDVFLAEVGTSAAGAGSVSKRRVALKLLKPYMSSAKSIERFQREVKLLARVQHRGMLRVLDSGTVHTDVGACSFIALEYFAGQTLADRLDLGAGEGADPDSGSAPDGPSSHEEGFGSHRVLPDHEAFAAQSAPAATGASQAALEAFAAMDHAAASSLPAGNQIQRILGWMERTARILAAVHKSGLLHLDVKPNNIMVGDSRQGILLGSLSSADRVVLLDLGIARDLSGRIPNLVESGSCPGTTAYMSPEQIEGRRDLLSPASDCWSLGVVIYECLCGMRPFQGETRHLMGRAIVNQEHVAPSLRNVNLGAAVDGLLERALAKDPAERFESATAMARAISAVRHGELLGKDAGDSASAASASDGPRD